ncbi:MAG: hypothetical protein A3C81_02805 [Candidatus Yanofskybacteria bacterium RIFCSPHIGHO2_02_FULL_46_19]|uniref:Uncharacterized protein n=1 Tax=Candidatus Yanofskybacteria bacterium RIFCSPHIGHO2_02_FULL_46_19 TaxID=1802684 RepID=A0A1F8FV97_9BACT|nr:MAG: hypothetical protein A3C81_02805 [Candidatus Yanofskybacteria bacterium RIFCSPHIGHO2_02_FULL_46_19]
MLPITLAIVRSPNSSNVSLKKASQTKKAVLLNISVRSEVIRNASLTRLEKSRDFSSLFYFDKISVVKLISNS